MRIKFSGMMLRYDLLWSVFLDAVISNFEQVNFRTHATVLTHWGCCIKSNRMISYLAVKRHIIKPFCVYTKPHVMVR